ncbi:MAG: 3-keto-disaccharide hydrolase [Bryobacteraceae bacterium]
MCVLPLLLALASDFDGRWNLTVIGEPRSRAWWLEVRGTKGRFVGFPGGDMNDVDSLAVRDGELTWSFHRNDQRLEYRARRVGDELHGSRGNLRFVGRRAPVLPDQDGPAWKPGPAVALFNGKNLDGWRAMVSGKDLGWTVKDGLLVNVAGANNLVSERKFFNFALRAEYRIHKGSNSGIGLRGRYEIQILDDFGRPPGSHGHGALYSRIVPSTNASKPPGEWQTLEVRLVGRQLTVVLNGSKIIDKREVEGLTAIASDADEAAPGPITLQGDHKEVEFRSFVVTPLAR